MRRKNELNERCEAQSSANRRRKRKNYTDEIYGARLHFEDARILNDYSKANKLDRSDVVRRGLHHFVLWLQMRFHKKDPLGEKLERILAEKIEPLSGHLAEVSRVLNELAGVNIGSKQTSAFQANREGSDLPSAPHKDAEETSIYAHVFKEQKQLIEQTLMAAMLTLRLHISYLVEPILRAVDARTDGRTEAYLQAAIQGRERWSETTREVITRTGNRILFELNLITKEDWEKLLEVYHNHDMKG